MSSTATSGALARHRGERGVAVVDDDDAMAVHLEDASAGSRRSRRCRRRARSASRRPRPPAPAPARVGASAGECGARQADDEARAAADAFAAHRDLAAVQMNELARQRQADAQAGVAALEALVGLLEEIEDPVLHRRVDADAGVAHGHLDARRLDLGLDVDAAARRRVAAGVVEQVREHLQQPRRVADHRARHVGPAARELQAPRRRRRLGELDRRAQQRDQLDVLHVQRELAGGDARDVEQVVDQAHHVAQLAIEDARLPCRAARRPRRDGAAARPRWSSARAGCAARGRGWRGTRPSCGRRGAARPRPAGARPSRARARRCGSRPRRACR